MMNYMLAQNHLVLLIIFSILSFTSSAQEYVDYIGAKDHASQLHNHTLVVRFSTYAPKLRYLKNSLLNSNDEKASNALQKEISALEINNQERLYYLKNALEEEYKFSKFLIMPDSLYKSFINGTKNVFFNDQFEIDSSINLEGKIYYMLINGSNEDQWILVNQDLRQIDRPFPYKATVFMSGLRRVLFPDEYYKRQLRQLNSRLFELING